MEDLSGRSFGVYRIVEPLGRGGMASVYKAYQPAVDRHVALKVLPSHLAQDPEFLARFEQEAKVLAKLQHPHILPVHDFGESDGFTYIVMPFIKTGTLAAVLTGQPLGFDQIKRVITQVGDALDCAHAQGLVHRDVKPSNILLDERGNCLLADFGIAKILEGADTLTATGSLIGTPQYMSPEQGMGKPIDGRSDIYSLGVVLYEMATGQVPFEAETPLAVVVKHIRDPLPVPSRVNPDIPEPLQRMIFRAMHKEPSERFPTASAMVEAMSTMTVAPPQPAELTATVPIGGVPPLPTAATDGSRGVDDVTVPIAVRDGAAKPAMAQDAAATTATPVACSDQPAVATGETSGMRRPVAIGAAALVVLALLFFFMRGGDSGTELTQALNHTTSGLSEAASASAGDRTPPVEGAVAEPADTTTPASSTSNPQPDPDPGSTTEDTPATAATGELLISVDRPSSVTVDTDAAAAIERESALLSAVARAEENRLRRDAEAAARDPFPDQGDGTFLDRQTGLLWTATSSPRQGNDGWLWTNADAYCEGLTLGSTSNWQLPSREELDPVLQRLDPARYPWGLSLWSASRPFGEANRLWVTNSPLSAPEWSSAVRDASARRLTHRAVCVAHPGPR